MKITKTELRKLILQELDTTSVPGYQQSLQNIAFRTGPFTNLITVTSDTLDRLIDFIRDSEDLEKMDLEGLKNNELQRLMDKIAYLESVIDAKLKGTVHNTQGYE
jgi:hypothetical protein